MLPDTMPVGVLLLQLGTPDSPAVGDVRRYLRQFLSDPRVIDLPGPLRRLLLEAVILPFRPRRSAHAYRQIWTDAGSPLTIHTHALAAAVADRLGDGYRVEVGMRYRQPSIADAAQRLVEAGCRRLIVLPLFPQYASSAGGSALAEALRVSAGMWNVPDVTAVADFHDDPGYLRAVADIARPLLADFTPDHVLFSYHGIPEHHVRKADTGGDWCLTVEDCCATITASNRSCYRAQAFATTRGLVAELGLTTPHSTSFQSRLAGKPWIGPFTDHEFGRLATAGVRRLAVLTPSFTADCLETLEEIGIRGRRQWSDAGGEDLLLVPCLNDDSRWADAVADLVRAAG